GFDLQPLPAGPSAPSPRLELRRAASLLARLAYFGDRAHPREVLAEMLWPEESPEATRVRLRQVLASLRRVLEPAGAPEGSVLVADRTTVRLDPAAVTTDVREFE